MTRQEEKLISEAFLEYREKVGIREAIHLTAFRLGIPIEVVRHSLGFKPEEKERQNVNKAIRIVKAGPSSLYDDVSMLDETDIRLIHECLILEYQKRFKHMTNRHVNYWTKLLNIFDVDQD